MLLRVEKWMRRLKKTTYVHAMMQPNPTARRVPSAQAILPAAAFFTIEPIAPLSPT